MLKKDVVICLKENGWTEDNYGMMQYNLCGKEMCVRLGEIYLEIFEYTGFSWTNSLLKDKGEWRRVGMKYFSKLVKEEIKKIGKIYVC